LWPPRRRFAKPHALGDEAAAYRCGVLPDAVACFCNIIVLIHVPPFRESCWPDGDISDDICI